MNANLETVTLQARLTLTLGDGQIVDAVVDPPPNDEFVQAATVEGGKGFQTEGDDHFALDFDGDPIPAEDVPIADAARQAVRELDLTSLDFLPVRWAGSGTQGDPSSLTIRLSEGVDVEWGEVLGDFFDHTGMVTLHTHDGTQITCELAGITRVPPEWFEAVTINEYDPEVGHNTVVDTRPIRIDTIHTITV